MAKYEWNLEDLRVKRNEILSLLEHEHESSDKLNLYYSKATYDYLFKTYCISETDDFLDDWEEITDEDLIEEFICEDYCAMDKSILRIVDKSLESFAIYNRDFSDKLCSFITINNDDLIDIVSTLFRNLPSKDFRKRFEYVIDKKRNLIHIQYLKNATQCGDIGFCYIDTINHIPYAAILRMNTIADLITLGHEIMHMIIRKESPPIDADDPRLIYFEVEGYFANMLICDFFRECGLKKEEFDRYENNDHWYIKSMVTDIAVSNQVAKNMVNKGKIRLGSIKKYFNDRNLSIKLNRKNLIGHIPEDIMEDSKSVMSYLIALDLYRIFNIDPEKGLYLLDQIPLLSGNNIEKELEGLGITFFQDGFETLIEKSKTLQNTKF